MIKARRPNAAGLVNALKQVRASIAHELVRARRKAGLSQQKLAELAGVRQETISRIESARHTATPRVLNKLMAALAKAHPPPQRVGVKMGDRPGWPHGFTLVS